MSWSNHSVQRQESDSAGELIEVRWTGDGPTVVRVDLLPPAHRQAQHLGPHVQVGGALDPPHEVTDRPELQGNPHHSLGLRLVEERTSEGAADPVKYLELVVTLNSHCWASRS